MASTLDVGAAPTDPSGLTTSEDDLDFNVQNIQCNSVQDDYYVHEAFCELPRYTKQTPGNKYTTPDYAKPEMLTCTAQLDDPTFAPWTTRVILDDIYFTAPLDTGASADLMRCDPMLLINSSCTPSMCNLKNTFIS
jgi:hypothetical protein